MELGPGLGIGFQGTPVTPDYNPLLQESIRLGHERRAATAKANEDDFKFQKDILDNLNPEGIYSGHIGDVQNVHNDFINGILSLKKELGSGYSNDPRALQLGLTARQRAKDIKESSKNIAAIKEGEVLNQGLFENQEQAEKYKTAIRTGAYNRQMGEDVFHFKDGYVPQGMYMKARNPVEELQKIFTPLGLNESVTGMKNQNNGFEKVQVSKATPYDQGMRLANDEWTAHETEYKGNGISKEQYLQNAKDALKGITVENLREVPGFGKHSGIGKQHKLGEYQTYTTQMAKATNSLYAPAPQNMNLSNIDNELQHRMLGSASISRTVKLDGDSKSGAGEYTFLNPPVNQTVKDKKQEIDALDKDLFVHTGAGGYVKLTDKLKGAKAGSFLKEAHLSNVFISPYATMTNDGTVHIPSKKDLAENPALLSSPKNIRVGIIRYAVPEKYNVSTGIGQYMSPPNLYSGYVDKIVPLTTAAEVASFDAMVGQQQSNTDFNLSGEAK